MNYLSVDEILEIHAAMRIADGMEGIRDWGVLYYAAQEAAKQDKPFSTASIYLHHILHYQAFLDGNHRTSFAAAAIFLRMNGYKVKLDQHLLRVLSDIKDGKYTEDGNFYFIADYLKSISKPKKSKTFNESKDWYLSKFTDIIDGLGEL